MVKSKVISIAAASILVATLAMTGCGSSDSSSSTPKVKEVTVSDGYVVAASVKATGYDGEAIEKGNGIYEFPEATSGTITVSDGVNDVNGNGVADQGEPLLPRFKAPAGYKNINPFTTVLVDTGMTPDELAQKLGMSAEDVNNFDIDVVAKAKDNPILAREAAKLTLLYSYAIQNIGNTSSSDDGDLSSFRKLFSINSNGTNSNGTNSNGTNSNGTNSNGGTAGNIPSISDEEIENTIKATMEQLQSIDDIATLVPELKNAVESITQISDATIASEGIKVIDATTKDKLIELNGAYQVY